jgi:apolipoprotein D and lipocalin family protein
MKKEIIAGTALAGIGLAAFVLASQNNPLETVKHVDLEKYLGKWYEIARFPQRFENGCTHVVAEYALRDDGKITVKNSCIKNGKPDVAMGIASPHDKKTNAKLDVQFFWPINGKYWIIALAPDYSYAMVGHPNRKYLWILNRKPVMDSMTYNHLVLMAAGKGFDVRKLEKTVQEEG